MDLPKAIFLTAVLTYVVGIAASNVFSISIFSFSPENQQTAMISLTASVFILSMLFFGKFSPIVMGLVGIIQGQHFLSSPYNVMHVVPTMIAAYAGTMLGQMIEKDAKNELKESILPKIKKIIILAILAMAFATAIEMAIPELPQLKFGDLSFGNLFPQFHNSIIDSNAAANITPNIPVVK